MTKLRNKNPELIHARFSPLLEWAERSEALPAFRAAPSTND